MKKLADDSSGSDRRERETERELAKRLDECVRELEKLRRELLRAEKMAALGRLVAGVAHEMNTPLGAIRSNTDLLTRAFAKLRALLPTPTDPQLAGNVERLLRTIEQAGEINEDAASRLVTIVGSIRNFARVEPRERVAADIHEGLDSTLTLVHHELKRRVQVVKEYGQVPPIPCVPDQLNQVFMNVLVNASQAIPDRGTITIRTGVRGDRVSIEISDTGRGIPPEHRSRIFEPGFTTKEAGEGTGLGLSIVREIVAAHRGEIEVESEVGRGTTFRILLPLGGSPSQ